MGERRVIPGHPGAAAFAGAFAAGVPGWIVPDGVGDGHQHGDEGRRRGGPAVHHDPVASISQPVRRLRGFARVTLEPGASETVPFTLDRSDFGFYGNDGRFLVETGRIDVYAGNSSRADLRSSFTVTR
jgi:hypothetical protein